MLYVGEGYNKMFLVNQGKIIWTYSTGKGNEYDDVWELASFPSSTSQFVQQIVSM